ncbi:DoxX family protein [Plantactinospora sp. WMMC1484]|uniref:DoxX family protein n=1 Tax=Plantactinospora sp. WMMC1484 TaxID=3404122 RepID=UPI003BF46597
MNIALWIVAIGLAAAFLGAGAMKLLQPKEKLVTDPRMGWAEPFPPNLIKTIGALEILAAIGLTLPALLDIAPILVPLAATGLVVIMVGATVTHGRRGETQSVVMNLVLLVLAAFVAWGRFGPYAF